LREETMRSSVTAPGGVEPLAPGLTGTAAGSGPGILGKSKDGPGVEGDSNTGPGVAAQSQLGPGITTTSNGGNGLTAETTYPIAHAIAAYQRAILPGILAVGSAAIYGECKSGYAGHFAGKVQIDGALDVIGNVSAHDVLLTGQDCAEHFESSEAEPIEPGTVMVLGEAGSLQKSNKPYDKRVAGIVSGAGPYKAGIILGHKAENSNLIALSGKVLCRVDAEYGAIEVGDLLTTSRTPGHAMRAADPDKVFGTVLGKAMACLPSGRGLIPVLVGLL
jgi:hypothetical protein